MFPTPTNPVNGVFVYHRVKELIKRGFEIEIVDPQPQCLPFVKKLSFSKQYCSIPKKYEFEGIEVFSPKYIYFPVKFLRNRIGVLMSKATLNYVEFLEKKNFSLIHAHGAIDAGIVAMNLSKKLELT